MKSLSLLVRIDQMPEFQVGRGNIHIEGCSQHLLASNTVTVPTVTHSHSLPPGVSLRVREYGGRREKRENGCWMSSGFVLGLHCVQFSKQSIFRGRYFILPPHRGTLHGGGNKKGTLEEITWPKLVISKRGNKSSESSNSVSRFTHRVVRAQPPQRPDHPPLKPSFPSSRRLPFQHRQSMSPGGGTVLPPVP